MCLIAPPRDSRRQHDVATRSRRLRPPAQPMTTEGRSPVHAVKRRVPTLASRSLAATRVCDGNNIAACGVPVVDTMGVRGGKITAARILIVDSLNERAACRR